MWTFNLRRHSLYSTWGNSQLSSFPTLLICHSLNSLLFGCPWVCTEGSHPVCLRAALSIFIFMYYVMGDSCKSLFRYPFSFLFNLSFLFLISLLFFEGYLYLCHFEIINYNYFKATYKLFLFCPSNYWNYWFALLAFFSLTFWNWSLQAGVEGICFVLLSSSVLNLPSLDLWGYLYPVTQILLFTTRSLLAVSHFCLMMKTKINK